MADTPDPSVNGAPRSPPAHRQNASEADAQEAVITSLRAQIQDLFSQVTQLNGKLIKSYDRVSDLEDDVHMCSAQARQASLKISQLELERTQHLSALNTGLLVEKSHVTAELTRLMEKATEEAAQRGQAETAKANIEKDLDDLSATLFAQANTMVAEARYSQAMSARRVEQAETALKGAEEMVGMMQQQMQEMQFEKDEAERKAREIAVVMGKGKWVDRRSSSLTKEKRLLSSHLPYQEFLLFVAHLRSVHPSSPSPPAMTTLLPMAFLARLSSEDSEPTVRLDLAPSLNWLSRRSVLAAIHTGQLTIEPMSSSVLLSESSSTNSNIPGLNSSNNNISCALCGTPIFSNPDVHTHRHVPPPTHPSLSNGGNANSWSASVLKKTLAYTTPTGSPTPPPRSLSRPAPTEPAAPHPPQIYIFRIATPLPPPQPTHPPTREASPSPFLPSSAGAASAIYPLCTSGWCLARLRTTCTLWGFVRTGVVERVWEEEVPSLLPAPPPAAGDAGGPPPVPPRRRGLWGMASKLGERAASWSGDSAKEKKLSTEEKSLPTPPPVHPAISAPARPTTPAPPLPKRNERRMSMFPPPATPERELPNPHTQTEAEAAPPSPQPAAAAAPAAVSALKAEEVARKRMSAHQVPLPDSRPQTPIDAAVGAGAADATAAAAAAVPPAPATGAPPPLPRRAAARAVRPVPPPPGAAAPAGSPAPANPIVPEAEAASKPAASEAPAAAEATAVDESKAAAPEIVEKVADADVLFAAEVDGDVPATEAPPAVEAVVDKEAEQDSKAEEAKAEAEVPRVDSPVSEKREMEEKPAANGHLDEDAGEEKKDEEEDHEAYVGDVTWEERTWKELVRLREDMFWARIGAARS
ncbi:proline-rich protein [Mycena albidolilacea]|uniref:Proline-rich protein n=1 Tax=Mycena albidolilacea TaxID=1033008 RepID=A0AAD7AJK4_9AGAR|nr:proline-rich protein [Mycena albidolilacea]